MIDLKAIDERSSRKQPKRGTGTCLAYRAGEKPSRCRCRARLTAIKYMKSKSRAWRARGGLHLIDFARKHGISLDWLFLGDIRSLALMTRYPGRFAQ